MIPVGWKLVPIEPTAEQVVAGNAAEVRVGEIYKAMVEAAPEAPAQSAAEMTGPAQREIDPDADMSFLDRPEA